MHPLFTALLDLVFPPSCPCCRRLLAHSGALACPRCSAGLPWLTEEESAPRADEPFPCVAAGWYRDGLRELLHAYKFEGQRHLATPLALPLSRQVRRHYGEDFDLITWVPVSPRTLKNRGYDQARLLAQVLGAELARPAIPLLQKPRHTPAQSSLKASKDRRTNVTGAFAPADPAAMAGRRVLLVDDVYTTGATLEESVRILSQAGAARVLCAVLCRTPSVLVPPSRPR